MLTQDIVQPLFRPDAVECIMTVMPDCDSVVETGHQNSDGVRPAGLTSTATATRHCEHITRRPAGLPAMDLRKSGMGSENVV